MHEAGHAVAAIVLGFDLESVDIEVRLGPAGMILGQAAYGHGDVHFKELAGKEEVGLRYIVRLMAGPRAEAMVNPEVMEYIDKIDMVAGPRAKVMVSMDMKNARQVALVAICDLTETADGWLRLTREEKERKADRLRALLDRGKAEAAELVQTYRPAIEEVAALLLKRKRLTGAKVAAIVAPYLPARIAPTVP
jgi:ATP-dependent Zn protease